jgi:hypothetical protein
MFQPGAGPIGSSIPLNVSPQSIALVNRFAELSALAEAEKELATCALPLALPMISCSAQGVGDIRCDRPCRGWDVVGRQADDVDEITCRSIDPLCGLPVFVGAHDRPVQPA